MDPVELLDAAKRDQAAYILDAAQAKAAFEGLGHTFISQFQDSNSWAVLSLDAAGGTCLNISGTLFSDRKIGDPFDDIDVTPVDVGGGAKVTLGAYESAKEIWDWAMTWAPAGAVFNVCGHSLGGWRTSYTPLFIPAAQIGTPYAFEPPKGANLAFYQKYAVELANLVIVGQGRDIWMNYPRLGDWIHNPGSMVWIQASAMSTIDTSKWPGGFSLGDHSIDLEVSRLEDIVGSGVPA